MATDAANLVQLLKGTTRAYIAERIADCESERAEYEAMERELSEIFSDWLDARRAPGYHANTEQTAIHARGSKKEDRPPPAT